MLQGNLTGGPPVYRETLQARRLVLRGDTRGEAAVLRRTLLGAWFFSGEGGCKGI